MNRLDTLNNRLLAWKAEKSRYGNTRFDADDTIKEIEKEIAEISQPGHEDAELAQLRAALAQAQAERDGLLAEIKELRDRLAHEGAEVESCLKNIAEFTTQRRALEIKLSDALEELRLIKQTTRPIPGGLLDEKNQHGEYSMDTLPFDYQAYSIAGEPGHDTSGKPCWCGATDDGAGVIVHRDIAEVLTSARQLGQFDAQPDYAAARSAVESELRAIANIHGTADGLEPLDSVTGMLSQISDIIAGVVSQRDAATARATSAEDAAYSAQREAARLSDVAKQERDLAVGFQQDISHLSSSLAKTELARRNAARRAEQAEAVAARLRNALQDLCDDYQGKEMGSLLEARAALAGPEGGERNGEDHA